MIGSISYHRGEQKCGSILKYLTKGHTLGKSEILLSNFIGTDELNRKGLVNCFSPKNVVGHVSISFADQDKINSRLAALVAEEFIARYTFYAEKVNVKAMVYEAFKEKKPLLPPNNLEINKAYDKLDEYAFIIARHYDTEHRHIHIVFDCHNIMTGQSIELTPLACAKRLTEFILRQLEARYALQPVDYSWNVRRRERRTGIPLSPYYVKKIGYQGINKIKAIIMDATEQATSWAEFKAFCKLRSLHVEKQSDRLTYRYNDTYVKPSQLGSNYGITAIERCFNDNRNSQAERQRKSEKGTTTEKAQHNQKIYQR